MIYKLQHTVLFVFCVSLAYFQLYAQQSGDGIVNKEGIRQQLQGMETFSSMFQSQNTATNNSVYISQIGENNSVSTTVYASNSDIRLYQEGDRNQIQVNDVVDETYKLIRQLGNDNEIIDFSFTPNLTTKLEITQQGDGHYFERFGSNTLSNNLQFIMSGTARTIIVRSF